MYVSPLRTRVSALVALLLFAAAPLTAQVLHDNGPVVGVDGRSFVRAGGTVLGFGAQLPNPNSLADDFTVGAGGWTVSGFSLFGYQTGASAFTFTNVTWSVISGDVNSGTVVASGSVAPTDGGLQGYRVTSSSPTLENRPIFRIDADVVDFSLGAGTHWLRWSVAGANSSGPFFPTTSDGAIGNAQQSLSSGSFALALDSNDQLGVELPFLIHGTRNVVPEPASIALLLFGAAALAGVARRRRSAL